MKKEILIVGLLAVFLIPLASAGFDFTDYTMKWQLCDALNFTRIVCDTWWYSIADLPTTNTTCQVCNTTNATCGISNTTIDLSGYYTKAQVNSIVSSALQNTTDLNSTELETELKKYLPMIQYLNLSKELRDNIMKEFDKLKEDLPSDTDNSFKLSDINPAWILVVIVVAGGSIYLYQNKRKKEKQSKTRQEILNTDDDATKIAKMELELKKLKNRTGSNDTDVKSEVGK